MKLFSFLPSLFPEPDSPKQEEVITEEKIDSASNSISKEYHGSSEKTGSFKKEGDEDSEIDSADFQGGVKAAQAANQMWTRNQLIVAYILIWLVTFVLAFASYVTNTLTPYVTSSFSEHSLTATTTVISSMISGLIVLPYAKLLNVWGRPQCFALMVGSMTLGSIMMAGCNNVQTYCAAEVFFQVGYSTISFSLNIFIADTTSLRNRAFIIGMNSSPWLIIIWVYGPAVTRILDTMGFRWGFGIWAIVVPITCAPLFGLFYYNQKKAIKAGLIVKEKSNRTWKESFFYYCREFDVIGLLLIVAGLALFLLSFNLYAKQPEQWRSPLIICFIVIGGLLIIAFGFYEKYVAPVTFVPWPLMKDRTVYGTYLMAFAIYCGWYLWNSYFYSMLIVVFDLSITDATYITNIYTIGSCIWSIVMGVIIRYNGRLKWTALYFGAPITVLGAGLMILFRQPNSSVGLIVMCQIFIALGGGTLVICEQMTVMAVSSHQFVPSVLSMENMVISIGGSVGTTAAAAIWTGVFPQKLAKYLPESALPNLTEIYGSLVVQSSYPVGSPERDGINKAYGETQRLMLIAATCLYATIIFSIMFWKDVDVRKMKKVKGQVF